MLAAATTDLQVTLTPATADTPAKRILLAVQLMAETGDLLRFHQVYTTLVLDFVQAAPSACLILNRINQALVAIDLSHALQAASELVTYEADLLRAAFKDGLTSQKAVGFGYIANRLPV